jgi:hypothetical protein
MLAEVVVLVIPAELAALALVVMRLVCRGQSPVAMEPPILVVAVVGELQELQHRPAGLAAPAS